MIVYLDTSALVKMVIRESETSALLDWLRDDHDLITGDIARTELIRTVRRARPDAEGAARAVLEVFEVRRITGDLWDLAGHLDPPHMRSLDALHLAAALDIGNDLDHFVTYDHRLAEAAVAQGLAVLAPS